MSDNYKNLAIFGDSSADPNKQFSHSWVQLLEKEVQFDNFAKQGSSLIYTYDQLLKHGKDYKKLIIFIAPVGRLWMPLLDVNQHFVNQHTADLVYNSATDREKKVLTSIKSYFNDIWNFERECLFQQAIVDSIRLSFPNALLIPVTPDSIYDSNSLSIRDISFIDYEFYEVNELTPDFGRTCHMNKQNNKIFYSKIKEWLTTGLFSITIKEFSSPVESKEELFYDKKN